MHRNGQWPPVIFGTSLAGLGVGGGGGGGGSSPLDSLASPPPERLTIITITSLVN